MSSRRWELAASEMIGGMRPADGSAPFARGAAVLGREDAPGRYLAVASYDASGASGAEIDDAAWEGLVWSGQAMRLPAPAPAARDAALWLFRPSFADREGALDRLSSAGALILREEVSARDPRTVPLRDFRGPIAAIVREDRGNPIRDALAARYFDEGSRRAETGDWTAALALADLAFVLSRGFEAGRARLLAEALTRTGRTFAGRALLELAFRTHEKTLFALGGDLPADLTEERVSP